MIIGRPHYGWLAPPLDVGPITVAELARLDRQNLQAWARAAWLAWAGHHVTVLGWVHRWRRSQSIASAEAG